LGNLKELRPRCLEVGRLTSQVVAYWTLVLSFGSNFLCWWLRIEVVTWSLASPVQQALLQPLSSCQCGCFWYHREEQQGAEAPAAPALPEARMPSKGAIPSILVSRRAISLVMGWTAAAIKASIADFDRTVEVGAASIPWYEYPQRAQHHSQQQQVLTFVRGGGGAGIRIRGENEIAGVVNDLFKKGSWCKRVPVASSRRHSWLHTAWVLDPAALCSKVILDAPAAARAARVVKERMSA
jgi:hypothetical protein